MASIGTITGHISVSLGNVPLPVGVIEFDVPLTADLGETTEVDGVKTVAAGVDINRTLFKKQMAKTLTALADGIEAAFTSPGSVLLTCEECGFQLHSRTLATLQHEADGAHSLQTGRARMMPPTVGPTGGAGDSGAADE